MLKRGDWAIEASAATPEAVVAPGPVDRTRDRVRRTHALGGLVTDRDAKHPTGPLPRDVSGRLILDPDAAPLTLTGAPRTKWTLDDGLALVRRLEPLLASVGWHCGLAGGTLHKGSSAKDVDVIVFPRDSTRANKTRMRNALRAAGLRPWRRRDAVQRYWRKIGSTDEKWVEIWLAPWKGRVDVLVLS